jgi:hypothetical protein
MHRAAARTTALQQRTTTYPLAVGNPHHRTRSEECGVEIARNSHHIPAHDEWSAHQN